MESRGGGNVLSSTGDRPFPCGVTCGWCPIPGETLQSLWVVPYAAWNPPFLVRQRGQGFAAVGAPRLPLGSAWATPKWLPSQCLTCRGVATQECLGYQQVPTLWAALEL